MVVPGAKFGLLRHIGHTGALACRNLSAIGFDLTRQDAKQRRFTGAIGSDESDAGALSTVKATLRKRGSAPNCFEIP